MNDNQKFEVEDLRSIMAAQLKRLEDPNIDLEKEIKRASAIVSVGNVIVNSAKVEVDFMRAAKQNAPTSFIGGNKKQKSLNGSKQKQLNAE